MFVQDQRYHGFFRYTKELKQIVNENTIHSVVGKIAYSSIQSYNFESFKSDIPT